MPECLSTGAKSGRGGGCGENYCQKGFHLDKSFILYYNKSQGFTIFWRIDNFVVFVLLTGVYRRADHGRRVRDGMR